MTDEDRRDPRPGEDQSPWSEYRRLILAELQRLHNEADALRAAHQLMDQRLVKVELMIKGENSVSRQPTGALGLAAQALGVTPGMLWISLVLCGILVGKPFFDFVQSVLPFAG